MNPKTIEQETASLTEPVTAEPTRPIKSISEGKTKKPRQAGKLKMTFEDALDAADSTEILAHLRTFSQEEVCDRWNDLTPKTKEKILDSACSRRGKKATEHQVSLAHVISPADTSAATRLLYQAIEDSAEACKSIAKFWFSESQRWAGLGAIDEKAADRILPVLIEVAVEPSLLSEKKRKTKAGCDPIERKLYDFSRWAILRLAQWHGDKQKKQSLLEILAGLSQGWPEGWRSEIESLTTQVITNTRPEERQLTDPSKLVLPLDEKERLIAHAQQMIQARRDEIIQKQAEIDTLSRLTDIVLKSQTEITGPKRPSTVEDGQVNGLKNANAQLYADLNRETQLRQEAEMNAARMKEEAERLERVLIEEKSARTNEQKWFAEQIERETQSKVNGFKLRLADRLLPVFRRKHTTDADAACAELTDFLRDWFREIEERLTEQGVFVSGEKR